MTLFDHYLSLGKALKLGAAVIFAKRNGNGGKSAPLYLDIGARRGLPRAWRIAAQLGLIKPVFFEPDAPEADRLARAYPGATVADCALGARSERRELNLMADRGLSSLLRPDYDVLSRFERPEPWTIEHVVPVDVVRLDDVWDRYSDLAPQYVKVDVQGFEKDVLLGMGTLLDDVLCLEFEAAFLPFYIGQATFQEVFDLLHPRGFDLVKIRPLGLLDLAILEFNALMVRRGRHDNALVKLWKKINDVGDHRRVVACGY